MINLGFKKQYGDRVVLDIPSFDVTEGGKYAVIGANGSGKSTLLQIIAGIVKNDIKNDDITIKELKSKDICYMPQESFAFSMSVYKNVLLASPDLPRIKSNSEREYYRLRSNNLLDDMELTALKRKNAAKLSGGETQRMALCRALVKKHDFLLLDEPTSAMDVSATLVAERVLTEYVERYNPTVIFATHSMAQAYRIADEVIFLQNGMIIERGTADILKNPSTPELKSFLQNV